MAESVGSYPNYRPPAKQRELSPISLTPKKQEAADNSLVVKEMRKKAAVCLFELNSVVDALFPDTENSITEWFPDCFGFYRKPHSSRCNFKEGEQETIARLLERDRELSNLTSFPTPQYVG